MKFLVRFVQVHEAFRRPELEALAEIYRVPLKIVQYNHLSPYCVVDLPDADTAKRVISRSITCKGLYELWGQGTSYDELHASVQTGTQDQWPRYRQSSFRFSYDSFQGCKSPAEKLEIVESFSYTGFQGLILLKGYDEEFTTFEEYELGAKQPHQLYFGRLIGLGARNIVNKYTLKKRKYISTTSMDSELALIGANLALADEGKLIYDPFMGTGGLPLACSHFGAIAYGSDIDPRPLRGKLDLNVQTSFDQYDLLARYLGSFIGDLTQSPLRIAPTGWLDAIVCDPPYGVREGLRVLGNRDQNDKRIHMVDGKPAHLAKNFMPPKKAYSFEALLMDIMNMAALMLVDNGRLSFWMPTANDENYELLVPAHPALELVSCCVQQFNKWSRRLMTYRFIPGRSREPLQTAPIQLNAVANDLNNFRKRVSDSHSYPGKR